jgi:hypothetical protein
MKADSFTKDRVEIMQAQNVPEEKRTEYTKYLTGLWNQISGYAYTVETAIDHIQLKDMKAGEAVAYIDRQLEEHDTRFEQSMIENYVDSLTQSIAF